MMKNVVITIYTYMHKYIYCILYIDTHLNSGTTEAVTMAMKISDSNSSYVC